MPGTGFCATKCFSPLVQHFCSSSGKSQCPAWSEAVFVESQRLMTINRHIAHYRFIGGQAESRWPTIIPGGLSATRKLPHYQKLNGVPHLLAKAGKPGCRLKLRWPQAASTIYNL